MMSFSPIDHESARIETATIRFRNASCIIAIRITDVVHFKIREHFRLRLHGLQQTSRWRTRSWWWTRMDSIIWTWFLKWWKFLYLIIMLYPLVVPTSIQSRIWYLIGSTDIDFRAQEITTSLPCQWTICETVIQLKIATTASPVKISIAKLASMI